MRDASSLGAETHSDCVTGATFVMDTSSSGAETHSDCVSVATFVKRCANPLNVAGSLGRSSSTAPDQYLVVRLAVAALQQHRILVLHFSKLVDVHLAQYREVLSGGHCIYMRSVPTCGSYGISAIAGRPKGEVYRSLPN